MASPLDFIKERFPNLGAFSDSTIAKTLYDKNIDDIQNQFDVYQDYLEYLTREEEEKIPDTQRFGKYVSSVYPQPEEEAGIWETVVPSFKKGFLGLEATGRGALAGLAGEGEYQEEQLRKAQEVEAEQAGMIPDYIQSWRDIGGIGDLTRYAIQKFGESSPWMASAIAGGAIGSAALPGLGTIAGMGIGALAGSTAALSPMFFGQNVLRQAEQVRTGERQDINEATAALAAPVQALLDSVIYRLIPARLKGTTSKNIFRKILKGGVVGVPSEAVTEVGQQFIERLQAGLPLADEEAMREYEESAVAGGLLGGVIGGATGPFNVATTSTEEQKISKLTQEEKTKAELDRITEEASTPLELTEQEKIEQRDIAQPTLIGREEEQPLETTQVSQLQEEGKQDGSKLFIGDMLTEKLQGIIDTQGEKAAKEYYKGFSETFLTTRRTKAPAFESASKKVKKPVTTPQIGQTRFNVDEVSTDQFEEGKGYVVRDNKIDGEDSLAFRTKEEADTYISSKGDPELAKEDVTIPPRPGEVRYTAKDPETKSQGTNDDGSAKKPLKLVGQIKKEGLQGYAWDSKQKRWVDQWTGQRGTTPLKKTTVKEKRIPINLTDLSPKDQRKIDYHRNTVNRRVDKNKYPNTDLTEMIDSGVVPKDARLVENLTDKQQRLLKNRRQTNKDQWWTTDKELGQLGAVPVTEAKADAETKQKEKNVLERDSFNVDFEIAKKEDGRFQVNKLLRDQETNNVVQEIADSIHTDENIAGRRLRDLQKESGLDLDKINIAAGKPIISLEELAARDRSEGKIWSLITKGIKKITTEVAGPETGVAIAVDGIYAREGSVGYSSSEGTLHAEGFYDEATDVVYLSLQDVIKTVKEGNLDQLVSHESFHSLQRTIKNAKKNVFTVKEQNAVNEAFPEGTVDQLPDTVKKVLGKNVMKVLRERHGNSVIGLDEMQAYVFQAWNVQRAKNKKLGNTGSIVQKAFNKIANILNKTKRFLQGKGYNTWESVFDAASEGEIGRRGIAKTETEAKTVGERRAKEIAEAQESMPISEIEGKRLASPQGEIKASVAPTTVYPKSNVRGTINSNNPIFRPLGFRPSQEAMSILNNAADMIVETKKGKVPKTETERINRSSNMQPAYNEINNFKNKLISEKPEQENVVREMIQPMVNAAVAVRHGHKFDITDTDTGDSITIGSGKVLTDEDANIHKDLSNVRVNRKPLYRAINEGFFSRTEEEQVQRADIEKDEVAERSAIRAEKLLKDRKVEGTTEEEVTEQKEQTDAKRAIEGKRPILKLKSKEEKLTVSEKIEDVIPPKFSVAVDMVNNPPTIEGTGNIQKGKKRILVENILDHLENDTRSKNDGQPLDITNEENFQNFVDQGVAEFEHQMSQPDEETGMGWYDNDVEEAMALLDQYIPELTEYPVYKELMPFLTGAASSGTPVGSDWKAATKVLRQYIKNGEIPTINEETGKQFTRRNSFTKALEFSKYYIDKNGLENFITWLDATTTVKDINAIRKESGVYASPMPLMGRDEVIGADMFGPKVGPFMKKLNGIKDDESVLDVWMNRHFNRKVGNVWQRNADGNFRRDKDGNRVGSEEARNDQERNIMNRYIREVAKKVGENTDDTQAVLWYFEQGLYTKLGVKSEPASYADKTREEFQDESKRGLLKGEKADTKQVQVSTKEIKASVQVSNHFDGANPDIEAEGKLRIDTAEGIKFSTSSIFSGITEEGLKSLDNMAVEERSIRDVNALSNNKIYQAVNGRYGPRGVDLRVKLQDKLYGLRRIQDRIEKKYGKKIPNALNAYLAEELYWGRTGERLHQLRVKNVEPINDLMAENKITLEEVDLFLVARHAKERNEYILKTWDEADGLRNTKNRTKEQEERYNQIKSYLENTRDQAKNGSGMTDAEATKWEDYYSNRPDGKVFDAIGEKHDALMRLELDIKLDGNLISQEQYDFITKGKEGEKPAFKKYVPLAGLDFDIDVENPKMGGSGVPIVETQPRKQTAIRTSGFQVKDTDFKIKKGRGGLDDAARIATNTYSQAVAKVNNAIIRAEKNKVALAFNEFAKKYYNEKIVVDDKLFVINPTEEQINSFDADQKEYDDLRKQKQIFKTTKPSPGHKFEFRENGEKRIILLTNDYLARALKDTGVEAGNKFLRIMSNATRYLAVINTAFSPEFILTNAIKDIQTAGINLSDEQTVEFRNKTIKNWRKSLRAARRVEKDPQAEGEWENYYRNYAAAGGKVGFFTSMKTPDVMLSELQKDINQLSSEKASKLYLSPKGNAKKLIKLISRTNTAVENAIRLSAFQSAIEAGVSVEEAASLAKNLTVNFNRKGEWGGIINSMYLFYNASIQGSFRLFQAIGRSKKIRNISMGIVAGAFFLDMFNRALAEDDDDGRNKYDKINGWIKGHNLIFMNPFETGPAYIALPMPWGYNWLSIVGQTMSSSMPEDMGGSRKNEITIGENAARTGMGLIDAFSPLPVGSNFVDVISPAVFKPATQLIMNKDYAGRAIYPPDNPFDGNAGPPDSQRHWNASTPSTLIAQTLNTLTGGSPVRSGIADFHPDTLDFMTNQLFGSAGTFGVNTADLLFGKILSGNWDEISLNKVPFVRKFFKSQPSFINKQTYFDIRDEVKIAENLLEYLTEEREFGELRKARIEYRKLLQLSPSLKSLESKRRQIRKAIKKIEDNRGMSDDTKKDRIKMYFEREERLLAIFIKRADRLLK